jgi:acyl-CoA thioester hydrolase
MRPPKWRPTPLPEDSRYVRDATSGMAWHRVDTRVMYIDTDRSGVVYHSNYLRYFELGRGTLLRDAEFPYRAVEEAGFIYPIVDLGVTFHKPLRYDDRMWIYTRFREVRHVHVTFDYLITSFEGDEVVCRGFTKHCATNTDGTPVAVDPMTLGVHQRFPS